MYFFLPFLELLGDQSSWMMGRWRQGRESSLWTASGSLPMSFLGYLICGPPPLADPWEPQILCVLHPHIGQLSEQAVMDDKYKCLMPTAGSTLQNWEKAQNLEYFRELLLEKSNRWFSAPGLALQNWENTILRIPYKSREEVWQECFYCNRYEYLRKQ